MIDVQNALVIDCETFPNVFTLTMRPLFGDALVTWEISDYRDDRQDLMQWLNWLTPTQTVVIGFNIIHFDYPVIDYIFRNPNATVEEIYAKAMSIIEDHNKFAHTIWASDRIFPVIDLFTLHHFNNRAKSTSLKALQINMRSPSVVDMPIENGKHLTEDEVVNLLIPYNIHDVDKTVDFGHYSMKAIEFRQSLVEKFGVDVMNWPDTKIGSRMMEDRLGQELCYDYSTGRKKTRQTPRTRIALADIIFPYVRFEHPEFNRVLDYLKAQVLTTDEINAVGFEGKPSTIKTKGVFTDVKATVWDLDYNFGTGGIHGSVHSQKIEATDEWLIRDIDVASLYPSIAIVNRLAPAHLGERFCEVYSQLPLERKKWQQEKGKKCVEANTLKLASNGVYGNSNNAYSVFYDPQFTLTITINGQLMLCMLAERLANIPTVQIIQINTDGITYRIRRDHHEWANDVCAQWEKETALVLEAVDYSRMWIRDVNNYIAEDTDGNLKLKGAYWTPDALDYHNSISEAQPPAWHKDLGNLVSIRAAVANMVYGVPVEQFIKMTTNPYDFMCRVKAKRSDQLMFNNQPIQKTSRYYVSNGGGRLVKVSPPAGTPGAFKRAPRVTEAEYQRVMTETGGAWDERVCTKNRSTYEERHTAVQAGQLVTICNNVEDFDFSTLNYDWYIEEAKKLIIC